MRALVAPIVALLVALMSPCGGAGVAAAEATRWAVASEQSSISMRVRALGATQTGRFSRWSGDIRFDPASPRDARVVIDVEAASLTMRHEAVTRRAVGPGFLDAARFPTIRFRLLGLEPLGAGRYTARAEVTMKGRTRPVTFPVALRVTGEAATMTGGFSFDRADYGVGSGDAMDRLIGRDVRVDVALSTRVAA